MRPAQALECQKISDQLLGVLREFNCAWQERILRPVQCVRGIVEASPWIVNAIALSRDVGEPFRVSCAAGAAACEAELTRRCEFREPLGLSKRQGAILLWRKAWF